VKFLPLVAVFLLSYLAAGVFLAFAVDSFMYYPRRGLGASPADFGLEAEEVAFSSSDGTALHGWYLPRPGSGAVLVFLHGNAGNISHRLPMARLFARIPADLFLFDYRGYGKSAGRPRGEKPFLDAKAALATVRARAAADGRKVVLVGESIGASMALMAAAEEKVDGVVSIAAFTSTKAVARDILLFRMFTPLLRERYDALGALGEVRAPILFIHGTEDEVIPFSHSERLYAAAPGKKEFLPVAGGMHNDLFAVAGTEIVDRIRTFIADLEGVRP
jgi:pimeloyl-ACP methyl ester carboxylesterase